METEAEDLKQRCFLKMLFPLYLLFLAAGSQSASEFYVVTVPSSFHPGSHLTLSVNILKQRQVTSVQATLGMKGQPPVAQSRISFSTASQKQLSLQVPPKIGQGTYYVTVSGKGGLVFHRETLIRMKHKSFSIFVQTDKAIYQPSQTDNNMKCPSRMFKLNADKLYTFDLDKIKYYVEVHFRVFGLKPDLKIYQGKMDIVLSDPHKNRIKQWLGVAGGDGVFAGQLTLSDEPLVGDWKIKVDAELNSEEKTFTVQKYVLPKFEVSVSLPSFVAVADESVPVKINAVYTFGKPVKGKAVAVFSIGYGRRPKDLYLNRQNRPKLISTETLDINGEVTYDLLMKDIKMVQKYLDRRSIYVDVNVTEELTGNVRTGHSEVVIYSVPYKVEILKTNSETFKPGFPYTGHVKVSLIDGRPIVGCREMVNLQLSYHYIADKITTMVHNSHSFRVPHISPKRKLASGLFNLNLAIPKDGIVEFSITAPKKAIFISGNIRYKTQSKYIHLEKIHSKSKEYIQVSVYSKDQKVGARAVFQLFTTSKGVPHFYEVLSRGMIVASGQIIAKHKQNFFYVKLIRECAPNSRILVYCITGSGELIADGASFNVKGALSNQVGVQFTPFAAQPAGEANITVSADPGSTVFLLAVDKSVLLLKSGNDITQEQVMEELQSYDTLSKSLPFLRNIVWRFPFSIGGKDTSTILTNSGVVVLTNAEIYKHKTFTVPYFKQLRPMAFAFKESGIVQAQQQAEVPVRKYFPETWLWWHTNIGDKNSVTLMQKVPDTITTWVATAFAINNDTGLGIIQEPSLLKVFQKFFISLSLPYSVVRGEELLIQASVFNYLGYTVGVKVVLPKSKNYRNIEKTQGKKTLLSKRQVKKIQVPHGKAVAVYFPILLKTLGNVRIKVVAVARKKKARDSVVRQLLVEAEGVPKEINQAVMVNLRSVKKQSASIMVKPTGKIVEGSKRIEFSFIGDILGLTVDNLARLLRMPYGCGEQNMLNFAPTTFVARYLSQINQLSAENRARAEQFMEAGYQRELNYQRKDGSFSAFGDRDRNGSLWLTAFVVKSFVQAEGLVFIDDTVVTRALRWMMNLQDSKGFFREPGRVIHKKMQGGSSAGVPLTAYALISLLEVKVKNQSLQNEVQKAASNGRTFLESQLKNIQDTYTLAITAYALKLANSSMASFIWSTLDKRAKRTDGKIYWQAPNTKKNVVRVAKKAIDIETAAYALLTSVKNKNIKYSLSIVKWLTAQRNSNGGFVSTQDTVVALQALTAIAILAYHPNPSMRIEVKTKPTKFRRRFKVDKGNAMILQTVKLPSGAEIVNIKAKGRGMGIAEVSTFYNVEEDREKPAFNIKYSVMNESLNSFVLESCVQWLLGKASGMAVEEIGVPSAFTADLSSLTRLEEIRRKETGQKKIVLYFDSIKRKPICVKLQMNRNSLVTNTKPVALNVFDYYEPHNHKTVFYLPKVLQGSSYCDVCGKQCKCKH